MQLSNEALLTKVDETASALLQLIDSFSEEQLNILQPGEGWTAAMVADHLYKASGIAPMYGQTEKTDRDPAEKVKSITDLFLDFSIKMISPGIIEPTSTPHPKEIVYNHAKDSWNRIREAIQVLDLSEVCMEMEIPGFGTFTRYEMLWLIITHTQRHMRQLQRIRDSFNS